MTSQKSTYIVHHAQHAVILTYGFVVPEIRVDWLDKAANLGSHSPLYLKHGIREVVHDKPLKQRHIDVLELQIMYGHAGSKLLVVSDKNEMFN